MKKSKIRTHEPLLSVTFFAVSAARDGMRIGGRVKVSRSDHVALREQPAAAARTGQLYVHGFRGKPPPPG